MMNRKHQSRHSARKGAAYVIALLLLSLFCTMGLAMASIANTDLRQCLNSRDAMNARLATESGLSFMLHVLDGVRLPGTTTQENFCENMRAALASCLDGTNNLGGNQVTVVGSSVFVPEIQFEGKNFCCWFTWTGENLCQMKVRGAWLNMNRHILMDFDLVPMKPVVFNYGLASRGQIKIDGTASIVGINYPAEASVLSASTSHQDALYVEGEAIVSGDLYTADSDSYVTISGSPTIAGTQDPEEIRKHIHQGVGQPDFPEVDVAPIAALATYTLLPSDPTNKGTLNNVRIPAGLNPVFSSDIILNGVVYVEAPNTVKFTSKCTLNGILVTEQSSNPLSTCTLAFDGQVVANGVEALPDTEQFLPVKEYTGTFICAPGFGITFAGNFTTIGGAIAADQLTFSGTAEGTVRGSVVGLKDVVTTVSGSVDIFVDRAGADPNPAGFIKSFGFVPAPDSYTEVTQ